MDLINSLISKYPSAKPELESFAKVHEFMSKLELEPFFEPKSFFTVNTENSGTIKPEFITVVTPEFVNSWLSHISCSTVVRINSLVSGILSELDDGRLYNAHIFGRTLMESAGVVTTGMERLLYCFEKNKMDDLRNIISSFYFGSSMMNEKENKDKNLYQEIMPESTKRFPPNPNKAIKALDRYLQKFINSELRSCRTDYALLCDYVHVTQRSTRNFLKTHSQTMGGFKLSYNHSESISSIQVKTILRILLPSMGMGYANSLFLYFSICNEEEGTLKFIPPFEDLMKDIHQILIEGINYMTVQTSK